MVDKTHRIIIVHFSIYVVSVS